MARILGNKQMGIMSVASLGIGSMVGAGIFSLMGQVALSAGDAVYLAFILGGIVALLSGYTYSCLGRKYPECGGIMDYYNQAFGPKCLSGTLSLVYLATLMVTIAMVSKAFGAYGARLFWSESVAQGWQENLLSSGIIVILGTLNMLASGLVGKAEVTLVFIKLSILMILVAAGLPNLDFSQVGHVHTQLPIVGILGSVGLTFFAYAGYGMMTNAAGDMKNPRKNLPWAIFLAISLVMIIYIALSLVVLDQISPEKLQSDSDTAIAQAARPLLGNGGFIAVSVAALLATASAINATFFSAIRIMQGLGESKQLGAFFNRPFWKNGSQGYVLGIFLILILSNFFNLAQTASIAGGTFLIAYLAVFVAHWKLRKETKAHGFWIIAGFLSMLSVFITFIISLWESQKVAIVGIIILLAVCAVSELLIQRRDQK